MDIQHMTTHIKSLLSLVFMLTIFSVFSIAPALAAKHVPDVAHGKTLVDKKCMGCHDNRQYTRPNRIVHTYEDLRGRVEFCDSASNANFSFDDLDDVVEYLNVNFYKFKK